MKTITPEALLRVAARRRLRDRRARGDRRAGARGAVERMIEIGPTAGRTVPAGPVFSA